MTVADRSEINNNSSAYSYKMSIFTLSSLVLEAAENELQIDQSDAYSSKIASSLSLLLNGGQNTQAVIAVFLFSFGFFICLTNISRMGGPSTE